LASSISGGSQCTETIEIGLFDIGGCGCPPVFQRHHWWERVANLTRIKSERAYVAQKVENEISLFLPVGFGILCLCTERFKIGHARFVLNVRDEFCPFAGPEIVEGDWGVVICRAHHLPRDQVRAKVSRGRELGNPVVRRYSARMSKELRLLNGFSPCGFAL
jgi:hypothetical protein